MGSRSAGHSPRGATGTCVLGLLLWAGWACACFCTNVSAGLTEPCWVFLVTSVAWSGGWGAAHVSRTAPDEPEGPTEGRGTEMGGQIGMKSRCWGRQGKVGRPVRGLAGSPRARLGSRRYTRQNSLGWGWRRPGQWAGRWWHQLGWGQAELDGATPGGASGAQSCLRGAGAGAVSRSLWPAVQDGPAAGPLGAVQGLIRPASSPAAASVRSRAQGAQGSRCLHLSPRVPFPPHSPFCRASPARLLSFPT